MPEIKDLTGQKFGRWTVIDRASDLITASGNHFTRWNCICDCGTKKEVNANSLLSGRSTSCGCYSKEVSKKVMSNNFKTHGDSKTRLYKIWAGMKKRCNNVNALNYDDYGGRGIEICDEWCDYNSFKEWAIKNEYNDSLSIDRIDVNGNYEPQNCRWVNNKGQANNRRTSVYITYNGETHTIAEWAQKLNMNYKKLHHRLSRGWSIERAFSER